MSVEISVVEEVTGEVVEAVARLMPQLSGGAEPVDADGLTRIARLVTNTVLLARVEGSIVGTLTLALTPLLTGLRAHIEDVVVDEAARGHGVGMALVDAALGIAHEAGARTVDLTSSPKREAANRLYTRAGFQLRETNIYRYTFPLIS
jgi:ribosomal protein S18 acetylase RimI-like enzyme